VNLLLRFLPNWKAQTEFPEKIIEKKPEKEKIKELVEHKKPENPIIVSCITIYKIRQCPEFHNLHKNNSHRGTETQREIYQKTLCASASLWLIHRILPEISRR